MQELRCTDARGEYRKFIIRRGVSPYDKRGIPSMQVHAGQEYLLAYDESDRCVGVIWRHFESRPAAANGQAEICFFDNFTVEFGKWHRMFYGGRQGGARITYEELEKTVCERGEFVYTGYIR